ncbi:methyl-accepting chemotaxis protein, partial [Petrotoga sp. 9PWA.NaAc.5.4]|uniref:HAMP domain-containing protein n=1 Tax=Petrotoga sp. 9PWA.NaAc.5.4 TaxID=1434328 RepID=UPI000CB60EC4
MFLKSIRGRITLIIAIILILFGAAVFFNIYSLIISNQGLESYKNLSDETSRISEIEMNFFEAALALKDYVIYYDAETQKNFLINISNIKDEFMNEASESTEIVNLRSYIVAYENLFNQIVDLNAEKENLIEQEFTKIADNLKQTISIFKENAQKNNVSTIVFYADSSLQIVDNIIYLSNMYFSSKSVGDKNNVLGAFNELDSQLLIMQYGLTSDDLRKLFTEMQAYVNDFKSVFIQIVETIESQEPIIQQMEEMRVEILDLLEEQRAELKVQQDTLGPTLIEENNTAIMLTIILTVIAFVVSIIMVIYLIRSITKPLTEFRNKINQFKEGDLTVDFESKSKDEIGQMANALSAMSKELRKSMSSIKGASEKVDNASIKLTKASQESRNNSEELKTQMDIIQTSAEETAGNVEEVTSGVDEV